MIESDRKAYQSEAINVDFRRQMPRLEVFMGQIQLRSLKSRYGAMRTLPFGAFASQTEVTWEEEAISFRTAQLTGVIDLEP